MNRDFFDPTPEEQKVVLIDAETLRKAEKLIESCEHCSPDGAEIPFDNVLDRVTRSDPSVTDYVLETPMCPNWSREVLEKTLVETCVRWRRDTSSCPRPGESPGCHGD
jgi:hypothetical protein